MTDLSLSLVVVLFIVVCAIAFTALGKARRFRAEVRKRGVSPHAIDAYEPDQGFLVVDYVYGGSTGIGSPVVWWSEPCPVDCIDYYSIKLVDLPRAERTLKSTNERFPDKIVVESTTLPAPLSQAEIEKIAM